VGSKLAEYSSAEIEELKNQAISYLRDVDYHEEHCAEKLGLDMLAFGELRAKYSDEFEDVYLRIRARMENVIMQTALGKLDPKSVQVSTARWWMERKTSDYRSTTKVVNANERPVKNSNGQGQRALDRFLDKKEEEENGAARNLLRDKTVQ